MNEADRQRYIEETKALISNRAASVGGDDVSEIVTVVITRADGGLTVKRIIAGQVPGRTVTPEIIEAEIAKRPHVFAGHQGWEIVPNDFCDDTTDRTFRNAWKKTPGRNKPDHDMPKAREIHRVYLRKARMAEFCRLDNDYRIADEAGATELKRAIGTERQKFRDVTEDPRIEGAQTVEELKALRLEVLIPETRGEKYMDKLRVSPAIPSAK